MKIALVHDYLSQNGGAERVLKAFSDIWPDAPIFVLFHDAQKIPYFKSERVRESFLAKWPRVKSVYQWYLPWMPMAMEKHDLQGFDVVLSSSSVVAMGVITTPHTLHISYCHTPPRFLWAGTHKYVADLKYNPIIKTFLPGVIHRMRLWDKMSADRVDHFVANSKTVAGRIAKYYRRASEVIYPPVDTDNFNINPEIGDYFLAGGRLVPYKRMDIIVEAFNRLRWPLKIFGVGSEFRRLKNHSRSNIEWLGTIDEATKSALMARARAFIHPQIEDLGITAIESMASGRPVITFAEGGATETVVSGETGVFFAEQNWESLFNTLLHFNHQNWDSDRIRSHAQQFSLHHFKTNIKKFVDDRWEEFKNGVRQEALLK